MALDLFALKILLCRPLCNEPGKDTVHESKHVSVG